MKTLFTFLGLVSYSLYSWSQSSVTLQINHLLDGVTYQSEVQTSNDLDQPFMMDRLEYYLSNFKIVHDGGQEILIEDLYVIISLLEDFDPSLIDLGSHDIQHLESVSFHLGIEYDANHADPALWPADHPLAPRWPAMHWGWAAGYRFIALEGMCGPNVDQNLEFHVIGDEFFKEIPFEVNLSGQDDYLIEIDAAYNKLMDGVDISGGLILHGNLGEIMTVARNLSIGVFTLAGVVSTNDLDEINTFNVYPNPSHDGWIQWQIDASIDNFDVYIHDTMGRLTHRQKGEKTGSVQLENSGIYLLTIKDEQGSVMANQKVLVH